MRTMVGHSIAVYEPDPKLSMVWPVPEEPEAERPDRFERGWPDWAEQDSEEFKSARLAHTVILLGGAPVRRSLVLRRRCSRKGGDRSRLSIPAANGPLASRGFSAP